MRPAFSGEIETQLYGVRGHNRTSAKLQKHSEQESDWTLSLHEHHISRLRVALFHSLQARVHGFNECSSLERHTLRNDLHPALDDPVHDPHVLREAAAGGF